ncbi:MAG: hypothetical protein ACI8TX_001772 [Hyphomicrobiaceae bacterium]|jgi:hypothetical protein
MTTPFTLIDRGTSHSLNVLADGDRIRIPAADIERATGWTLKPEGLCKDSKCVPVRDRDALADDHGIDLATFAQTLRLPLALDAEASCAALEDAATDRIASQNSLEAPDFELLDFDGKPHKLSDYRNKKVLLVVWASW